MHFEFKSFLISLKFICNLKVFHNSESLSGCLVHNVHRSGRVSPHRINPRCTYSQLLVSLFVICIWICLYLCKERSVNKLKRNCNITNETTGDLAYRLHFFWGDLLFPLSCLLKKASKRFSVNQSFLSSPYSCSTLIEIFSFLKLHRSCWWLPNGAFIRTAIITCFLELP